MANVFKNFITKIEAWFTRGKAVEVVAKIDVALTRVAEILPHVIPVVEEIAAAVPNGTLDEALAVYEKFVGPVVTQIDANPAQIGNLLLNAATAGVAKALPKEMAASVSTIQTAIQLAVVANKAEQ